MRAIIVEEVGAWRLVDAPVPRPGRGEALVRVHVTGLCRTDLKLIRSGHRDLVLPRVPGEEVVGSVVSLGPGTEGPPVGSRVYVYPGTSCGSCRPCKRGAPNLCESMQIMGFHRDGGFADYVVAPIASLIPLADDLPDARAVFAEPLSCCLNALDLAGVSAGDRVGVWGGGPAGTLVARAARARGADATIIEPDEGRRAFHRQVADRGEDDAPPPRHDAPPGADVDVAIVAVGSAAAYTEALPRLAPRGRLVIFSGLPPEGAALPIDLNTLHYLEQTLVGAYGCAFEHGVEAIRLLQSGAVAVDDLVSHRLPMEDLDTALDLVAGRRAMKVHLYPSDTGAIQ